MKKKFLIFSLFVSVFFLTDATKSFGASDIIINEIGATEPSGFEWVELYNRGTSDVDMSGYKFFEENTNHGLVLKQGSSIIRPGEFAVIVQDDVKFKQKYPNIFSTLFDSSWGSLNESGENIGLKDNSGNFLEQFISISSTNYSLERVDSNSDDYTFVNWQQHPSGNSVGQINFASLPLVVVSPVEEVPVHVVTSTDVVSEEVNNTTSTNFGEQNQTPEIVLVTSTEEIGESSSSTLFENTIISEQNTFVDTSSSEILQNIESVPLLVKINEFVPQPNDGEKEWIELYNDGLASVELQGWTLEDATGKISTVSTTLAAKDFFVVELSSSKLNNDGDSLVLKNSQGVVIDEVHYGEGILVPPKKGNSVVRRVDGFDANQEEDFGETTTVTKGQKNIFTAPYVAQVESNVSLNRSIKTPDVPVLKPVSTSTSKTSTSTKKIATSTKEKLPEFDPKKITVDPNIQNFVSVSEIYPAPKKGEDEFVELFNSSSGACDLSYFQLDDAEGGSKPFVFASGTVILPQQYLVIPKKLSHVSLNNAEDSVRLFFPNGEILEEVVYDDATKEYSFVKDEKGEWTWTSEITPGETNRIVEFEEVETKKSVSSSKQKIPVATTIENLDDFQSGDIVRIKGNVIALPGVFGSQIFYVSDSRAVQIYMSKKDFPVLSLGDEVQITGTLGVSAGETRVKVKTKKDIVVKAKSDAVPGESIQLSQVDESLQGKLAMVSGEVTEKKSNFWFVDDGRGEIQVSLKKGANIDAQKIHVGDTVEVTGLVLNSNSAMQLFPRSQKDVVILQNVSSTQVSANTSSELSSKNMLAVILGAVGSLLFGFLVKIYGNKILFFVKHISVRTKQKKNLG